MGNMLKKALFKALKHKAEKRLERLSREEVERWRSGMWDIAEEVIGRYSDLLIKHRKLAVSFIKVITPEAISRELVRRKPEFRNYWEDDVFYKRLSQEVNAISLFLDEEREK